METEGGGPRGGDAGGPRRLARLQGNAEPARGSPRSGGGGGTPALQVLRDNPGDLNQRNRGHPGRSVPSVRCHDRDGRGVRGGQSISTRVYAGFGQVSYRR